MGKVAVVMGAARKGRKDSSNKISQKAPIQEKSALFTTSVQNSEKNQIFSVEDQLDWRKTSWRSLGNRSSPCIVALSGYCMGPINI